MIGEVSGRPAATYSIGFEADGYDEMAYARIARKPLRDRAPRVLRHARRPGAQHRRGGGVTTTSRSATRRRCRPTTARSSAREDGVSTLLAGDGGDELFGGNSRYAKQRVFGWYRALPADLRTGVLEPVFGRSALGRLPLLRKGASYIEQAKVPMPDRLQMYNLLRRLGADERAHARASSPASTRTGRRGSSARSGRRRSAIDELDRTLAFDWRYTLAENDLPKVCGTTAAGRRRGRLPAARRRLARLLDAAAVADYKLKGLKLRWFFKEALRGFLPDEIIAKKKHGFGLPFGVWAHAPRRRCTRSRSNRCAAWPARGIVRPEFIRELIERYVPEHPGYYGEMVWILMILEQWLQRHAPAFKVRA